MLSLVMCFYQNLVLVAECHVDCWQTLQWRLLWRISRATDWSQSKQVKEHSDTVQKFWKLVKLDKFIHSLMMGTFLRHLFREAWTLWLLICGAIEKHLLTWVLTYIAVADEKSYAADYTLAKIETGCKISIWQPVVSKKEAFVSQLWIEVEKQ